MPKQHRKKGSSSPKHLKVKSSPKKTIDGSLKLNEDDKISDISKSDKSPRKRGSPKSDNESPGKTGKTKSDNKSPEKTGSPKSDNESPGKRGRKRKSSETELLPVDEKKHKSPGKKIKKKSSSFQKSKSSMESDDQSTESEISIPTPTKHNLEEAVLAVVQAAAKAKTPGKSSRGRPSKLKSNSPKTEAAASKRGRPQKSLADTVVVKKHSGKRGRPPSLKMNIDHDSDSAKAGGGKRGRPPAKAGGGKRGRPPTKAGGDIEGRPPAKAGSGKRGRPKGIVSSPHKADHSPKQYARFGRPLKIRPAGWVKPVVAEKIPRNRGRPSKSSKQYFGRPRGRPPNTLDAQDG